MAGDGILIYLNLSIFILYGIDSISWLTMLTESAVYSFRKLIYSKYAYFLLKKIVMEIGTHEI